MDDRLDRDITEFAELLYNFRDALTIKNIKENIKSFLLANHLVKRDDVEQ